MNLSLFLALTFGISLFGFACIVMLPDAKSPETAAGLPFWLLMVWGPSLAAIILALANGTLAALLARAIKTDSVPLEVWGLVLCPLLLLLLAKPFAPGATLSLSLGAALAMTGFNLVLGPLGEELGWRGFMQAHLNPRLGWMVASLIIGLVWFVWHVPLWFIDSPHAKISPILFGIHCMLYAVIIGAAYRLSGGSILPAILLHLTFNLAANGAIYAGFAAPNAWFSTSMIPYLMLATIAVTFVSVKTGDSGLAALKP